MSSWINMLSSEICLFWSNQQLVKKAQTHLCQYSLKENLRVKEQKKRAVCWDQSPRHIGSEPCPLDPPLPFSKFDLPQPLLVTVIELDLALDMRHSCRHVRIILEIIPLIGKGLISLLIFSPQIRGTLQHVCPTLPFSFNILNWV